MKKDAVRGKSQRSPVGHGPISAHRKSEAVLRLMSGEREDDVAHSMGCTLADLELWRHEFVVAGERRMGEMPLGWLERITSPFERLVPLATLISVSIAVVLFVQSQQKERESRDREAARELRVTESFNALDDKYIEHVKIC